MSDTYQQIYMDAAAGRADALEFLFGWNQYCHKVDDLIDNNVEDAQVLLAILVMANLIYSTPFYQQNAIRLRSVVQLVTNNYADSLTLKNETWADALRFSGNELVVAVAELCGGFSHARQISLRLREDSWNNHHDKETQNAH